jgi:hypothetical protein
MTQRRPSAPQPLAAVRAAATAQGPGTVSDPGLLGAERQLANSPRQLQQRQCLQAAFGPAPVPVAQRRIKTQVEAGPHRFEGAARYESTNNRGEGAGRKPLLVLPTATPRVELHVHLVPRDPPKEMTGWNLKDTAADQHLVIDNDTREIDAEDRALFDARAAGWKSPGSYPNDIFWSKPAKAEREAERLLAQDKQLAERRADYVAKLQAKRAAKVESLLNSTPLTLNLSYATRERRTKGARKETHSGYLLAVQRVKPLPELPEGCTAKYHLTDDGAVSLKFTFANARGFTASKAKLIAAMDEAPEGLAWTPGAHGDTEAAERLRIGGELDAYITAVGNGDHDAVVTAWSGAPGDLSWG